MGTRRVWTPSASSRARSSSRASRSPHTTTERGPLTAPSWRRPCQSVRCSSARSAGRATDIMPPRPASSSRTIRPRWATTRAPSSRVRAPATQAAAISPWEWPTTAAGSTPAARQASASDTFTAHSAGCTVSSEVRGGAPGAPRSTSSRFHSTWGSRALAHAPRRAAKAGECSRSSTPMPGHWEPWPGKTNTARESPRASPVTREACVFPAASASSPARRPARSVYTTTARCWRAARPRAREAATSCSSASWWSRRWAAIRAAWARRASGVAADTVSGAAGGRAPRGCRGAVGGASSRMTWALVPLTPKEDTPARRGRPFVSHVLGSLSSSTAPSVQSMCGEGVSACRVAGRTPLRIAMTILMTPATPAAAWVCPRLDLMEPSHSGSPWGRSCP